MDTSTFISLFMDLPFYTPILIFMPLLFIFVYEIKHKYPVSCIIQEVFLIPLLFVLNVSLVQIFLEPPSHNFLKIILFAYPYTIWFSVLLWVFFFLHIILKRVKPFSIKHNITKLIWGVFLLIAIICNLLTIPDRVRDEREIAIYQAISSGNLQSVKDVFGFNCPSNQAITTAFIRLSSNNPSITNYLLFCWQKTSSDTKSHLD